MKWIKLKNRLAWEIKGYEDFIYIALSPKLIFVNNGNAKIPNIKKFITSLSKKDKSFLTKDDLIYPWKFVYGQYFDGEFESFKTKAEALKYAKKYMRNN